MTKPLTELFESKVAAPKSDPFHYEGVGIKIESDRRKPIDLATKKLIEALEFYADKYNYEMADEGRNYSTSYVLYELDSETMIQKEIGTRARQALAEFRASLEGSEASVEDVE